MQPLTNILPYLAGYFDGEGCVTFAPGRISKQLCIVVTTSDKSVMEKFVLVFGGKLNPLARNASTRRQVYEWRRFGAEAQNILRSLLPWLEAKRDLALLALTYVPGKTGTPLTQEAHDARTVLFSKIHAINQRETFL